jgi:sugar/nucleoside kinase (ribokinase family)
MTQSPRQLYDVAAIGNALVDVISPCDDAFLATEGLAKGGMMLIDETTATSLHARMAGEAVMTSGGSAANTIAGLASFGGKAAFIGKVAADDTGRVFTDQIHTIAAFKAHPLKDGPATGRCLINVTPDGQRTMSTFLGAAGLFDDADIDPDVIEAAAIVYLEGYLFDPEPARRAFAKAAALAHGAGRTIALTLSDAFVVDRHREALLGFIETQVDLLFANETEICSLFGTDFETAIRHIQPLAKIAAITCSERGSVVVTPDAVHEVAAFPVDKVVDTTGAGDQYAAGFCFGLSHGLALPVCGQLGSLAAAEVISHYGPRPNVSLKDLAVKAGLR